MVRTMGLLDAFTHHEKAANGVVGLLGTAEADQVEALRVFLRDMNCKTMLVKKSILAMQQTIDSDKAKQILTRRFARTPDARP